MNFSSILLLVLQVPFTTVIAFSSPQKTTTFVQSSFTSCCIVGVNANNVKHIDVRRTKLFSKIPPGGIDFEEQQVQLLVVEEEEQKQEEQSTKSSSLNFPSSSSSSMNEFNNDTTSSMKSKTTNSKKTQTPLPFQNRGKVNEIDFCMSPSDVSLSRSYQQTTSASFSSSSSSSSSSSILSPKNSASDITEIASSSPTQQPRILSLTRALNNASNRAVRRILLSRSWPSAEALNLSLKQYLASSNSGTATSGNTGSDTSSSDMNLDDATTTVNDKNSKENKAGNKCPVPRPILNIIVRQSTKSNTNPSDSTKTTANESDSDSSTIPITQGQMSSSSTTVPNPLTKIKLTDEQWVKDQMNAFRETYGSLPGYEYADSYMDCILSLATSGIESDRVSDVSTCFCACRVDYFDYIVLIR